MDKKWEKAFFIDSMISLTGTFYFGKASSMEILCEIDLVLLVIKLFRSVLLEVILDSKFLKEPGDLFCVTITKIGST